MGSLASQADIGVCLYAFLTSNDPRKTIVPALRKPLWPIQIAADIISCAAFLYMRSVVDLYTFLVIVFTSHNSFYLVQTAIKMSIQITVWNRTARLKVHLKLPLNSTNINLVTIVELTDKPDVARTVNNCNSAERRQLRSSIYVCCSTNLHSSRRSGISVYAIVYAKPCNLMHFWPENGSQCRP